MSPLSLLGFIENTPLSIKMQGFPQTLKVEPDFSWVASEGNGNKLKHGMSVHFSTVRVVKYCSSLPGEGVESPSLDILGYPTVGAVLALRDAAVRHELDWTLLRGVSSLSPQCFFPSPHPSALPCGDFALRQGCVRKGESVPMAELDACSARADAPRGWFAADRRLGPSC